MKLHLGSGKKKLPGFLNVDIRPEAHPDYVADVRDLSIFPSDSVSEIYYCHGIEHLKYAEVQPALAEWRRILIPGGILRLSVPDMCELSYMYTYYIERGEGGATLAQTRGAISGGQEYSENIHYSVWDYNTIKEALFSAGYTGIHEYDAAMWLKEVLGTQALSGVYFDWSIGTINGWDISLNVVAGA